MVPSNKLDGSSGHVLVISTPERFREWLDSDNLFIYPSGNKCRLVDRGWLQNRLRSDGVDVNGFKDDEMLLRCWLPLFDTAVYRRYGALSYRVSKHVCWEDMWVYRKMDVTGNDSHILFGWYNNFQ